jgi:hypothetical protein
MFKYSEEQLIEKLALIFGWSNEKVQRTTFTEMMCKLVDAIGDYEEVMETQRMRDKDNLEIKKLLAAELVETKRKLRVAENTIEAIEVFIKEKQAPVKLEMSSLYGKFGEGK